jgi:hypothetical protein
LKSEKQAQQIIKEPIGYAKEFCTLFSQQIESLKVFKQGKAQRYYRDRFGGFKPK